MRVDVFDILVPVGAAFLFLGLSWSYARSVNLGRPLNNVQRRILRYSFVGALGLGPLMLVGRELGWPMSSWVALIAGWVVLLGFIAWWRHRRRKLPDAETPQRPISAVLREGLPIVGLLVCLIGSAIEWEFVAKGEGHLLAALLWSTGVPGMIWLARRNRRATVVTALRAFLGLMIIGALAQPSLAALVAVGATGVGLVVLERLWKKKEEPPIPHLTSDDRLRTR